MKITKSLIVFVCASTLIACQTHQLPKAKGKWTEVNSVGFIPHNVTKYSDNPATLNEVK